MAILSRRQLGRWLGLGTATWLCVGGQPVHAQHDVEYQVKAQYVYSFVQFISWPASAWTSRDAPFRICVAGANPFGPLLEKAVRGEQVDGHPMTVERPDNDAGLARCQVVFVSAPDTPRSAAVLKAISSASVLTIGESPAFLEAGGAVAFAIDGGRVRFDINLRAQHISDLRVSSKLLRVARSTWRSQQWP